MSEPLKSDPKRTVGLESWIPFAGRIQGKSIGRKEIITSKIVSLNGTIVRTKSGSYYKLLDPSPEINEEWLKRFNGSTTVFEAIEKMITENLKQDIKNEQTKRQKS